MRLINADEHECWACKHHATGKCDTWCDAGEAFELREDVKNAKTVDAKPVVHGEWEDNPYIWECNQCHTWLIVEQGDVDMNFCPNCGADMRKQVDRMTEQEAIKIMKGIEAVEGTFPEDGNDVEETLSLAIKALEKQIPKKPKQSGVTDSKGVFHPTNGISGVPYDLCPNCKTNLCTDGFFGRNKKSMKYCENCGQKLDWSDDND